MTKKELSSLISLCHNHELSPSEIEKLFDALRSVQESFDLTQSHGYFNKMGKDMIKGFFVGTVCI